MDRSSYGNTAAIIGQITDVNQLMAMMKQPQYAGFTPVIIARITEIKHLQGAAQGAQPQQPTVAQQAVQGIPEQPQQMMARGGIIAFKDGGKVKGYAKGHKVTGGKEDGDASYDLPDLYSSDTAVPDVPSGRESLRPVAMMGSAGIPTIKKQSATSPTPITMPRTTSVPASAADYFGADTSGTPSGAYGSRSSSGAVTPVNNSTPLATQTPPDLDAYIEMLQDRMGTNPDLDTARAKMATLQAGREEQSRQAPWMAVMRGGLGMAQAASEHPQQGILGAATSGATAGLGQYQTEREALNKEQEAELTRQIAMGQITRQEKMDLLKTGVGEYRADIGAQERERQAAATNQTARDVAAMHVAGQRDIAGQYQKPAQIQEANTQRFMRQAYARDIAAGIHPKTQAEYYAEASLAANPQAGIAGLRGDVSQANARLTAATKELQGGMANPARAAYLQQVVDSGGTFDPGSAGTVRPR